MKRVAHCETNSRASVIYPDDSVHHTANLIKIMGNIKNLTGSEKVLLTMASVVVALVLAYCLIAYTPLRTTIPGYPDKESRRAVLETAMRLDSLEKAISRWELYSENLSRVLTGRQTINPDSLNARGSNYMSSKAPEELRRQDSILKASVREADRKAEEELKGRKNTIESITFYRPVKGMVSRGYDMAVHPWTDITAGEGEAVCATLDGTLVYEGWSDEYGYVVLIQHQDDIISVYTRMKKVLKRTGQTVRAGEVIALVGSTGARSTGSHLHFELWHKGERIDPEEYIKF